VADLIISLPWSVAYEPLPKLIKEPAFKVQDMEILKGSDGVKVALRFSRQVPSNQLYGVREGTVWLDPAHSWRVDGFEVDYGTEVDKTSRAKGKIAYHNGGNSPVVREYSFSNRQLDTNAEIARNYQLKTWAYEAVPQQEFQLSAFGIPEPATESTSSRTRQAIFLINIALLMMLASILSYRFSKRRSGGT
jgi:hypothetical protein